MPSPQVLLRIPDALIAPLQKEAKRRKLTVQAIILEALGARYLVDAPRPQRGRNKKTDLPD